jgi:hypothetical protein
VCRRFVDEYTVNGQRAVVLAPEGICGHIVNHRAQVSRTPRGSHITDGAYIVERVQGSYGVRILIIWQCSVAGSVVNVDYRSELYLRVRSSPAMVRKDRSGALRCLECIHIIHRLPCSYRGINIERDKDR